VNQGTMDHSGHSNLVTSSEIIVPGNLEILAQTAASQSTEDASYSGWFGDRMGANL